MKQSLKSKSFAIYLPHPSSPRSETNEDVAIGSDCCPTEELEVSTKK